MIQSAADPVRVVVISIDSEQRAHEYSTDKIRTQPHRLHAHRRDAHSPV